MNIHHAPAALTPARHERHSYARLHGRWPVLARGVWITVVIGTLSIFFASLPEYLTQLHTPCVGAACSFQQLTPEQVGSLQRMGLSLGDYTAYTLAIALAIMVVCLVVSTVIVLRRPDDRMALIVALMLVTLSALLMSESVAASSSLWQVPNQYLSFLCVSLLLLVFSLFPTGRFVPRWMRWLIIVYLVVSVPKPFFPMVLSTMKIHAVALGFLVFLIAAALLVVVQLYRYRHVSSPLQQQQTKWVVFGFVVVITSWVIAAVPYLLFPTVAAPRSLYLPTFIALQSVTVLVIPLSFGIATLRYRLWDIDTIIHRTLVYGALTVLLTGVYGGLVIGLQALLRGLIRQDSSVAIVFSTLAVMVLFQPLRQSVQRTIDRRFYRRKYDAAKALAAFSTTLSREVDLDRLREQVLAVVEETMLPTSLSLWIRPMKPRDTP